MNKRKEKISAFLDNDMHSDELMSFSLSAESDDAKIAQCYQMLGDALRGEINDSSFVDVSQEVREALLDDNTFDEQWHKDVPLTNLRMEVSTTKIAAISDKPGIFIAPPSWHLAPKRKNGRPSLDIILSAWLRPVAGMAVAVTVAVVIVVTLSAQDTALQTPVAVNLEAQPVTSEVTNIAGKMTDNNAINIDQHLINKHLEFATQDALQGRLPYVRAVSFEPKQ